MAANPNGITGVHDEARTTAPANCRGAGLTKKLRVDREVDRVKGSKGKGSETELLEPSVILFPPSCTERYSVSHFEVWS